MPTKDELEKQIKNARHKAFVGKMTYLTFGCAGGWVACYIYVIHFGGVFPPSGTFAKFLTQSWALLIPIIPIIVAIIQMYNRRKSDGD